MTHIVTHDVNLAAATRPSGALAPLAPRFTLDSAAKYGIFDRDRQRALDGGWWPRSRDAVPELTALAAGLTALFGKVIRLAVDRADFDDIPHKITVNGRIIRVGWFDNLNHIVIVTRCRQDEFLFLVIPPHTPPAAATAALASAAAATGSGQPQQIPAHCGTSGTTAHTTGGRATKTTTNHGDMEAARLSQQETLKMTDTATPANRHFPEPDIDRWADDGAPQHTEPSPT